MILVTSANVGAQAFEIADITWTLGPDHPVNRKGGAFGAVNGVLVSAGGSASAVNFETASTYAYTPGAAGWTQLPDMPQSLAYLDGVVVDNVLYTIGGRVGGMGGSTIANVHRLRNISGTWAWDSLTPSMSLSRGFHTAAVNGTQIVAPNGWRFASGQPVDHWDRQVSDVDSFDTANPGAGWDLLPNLPGVARSGSVAAAAGGKVYVFGGTNLGAPGAGYDSDRLHDAYVLNPGASDWISLSNLPFGFSNAHAVVYDDRYIIMVGGVAEISEQDRPQYPPAVAGYYNNMVLVFDTLTEDYHIMPSVMPYGTGDIRAAMIGNTIYAVGGENIDPNTSNTTHWFRMGEIQLVPEPLSVGFFVPVAGMLALRWRQSVCEQV